MSVQQCNGRHGVSECVDKANKAGREQATVETNKLVEHEETRDKTQWTTQGNKDDLATKETNTRV